MIDASFINYAISEKRKQRDTAEGREARQLEIDIKYLELTRREVCAA